MSKFIFLFLFSFVLEAYQPIEWAHTSKKEGWINLEDSRKYHQNNELQRIWAEQVLTHVQTGSYKKILDYGSGDGKITATLAIRNQDSDVVGFDISESMFKLSSLKYQFGNLRFSTKEVKLDKDFDLVVSFNVLHLVSDPIATLKSIRSRMKSGGKFVAVYPSGDVTYLEIVKQLMEKYKLTLPGKDAKAGKLRIRNLADIDKILSEAGFIPQWVKECPDRVYFFDDRDFVDWSVGTTSKNFGLPSDIEEKFHYEFIAAYKARDPESNLKGGGFAPKLNHIEIVANYLEQVPAYQGGPQ